MSGGNVRGQPVTPKPVKYQYSYWTAQDVACPECQGINFLLLHTEDAVMRRTKICVSCRYEVLLQKNVCDHCGHAWIGCMEASDTLSQIECPRCRLPTGYAVHAVAG